MVKIVGCKHCAIGVARREDDLRPPACHELPGCALGESHGVVDHLGLELSAALVLEPSPAADKIQLAVEIDIHQRRGKALVRLAFRPGVDRGRGPEARGATAVLTMLELDQLTWSLLDPSVGRPTPTAIVKLIAR